MRTAVVAALFVAAFQPTGSAQPIKSAECQQRLSLIREATPTQRPDVIQNSLDIGFNGGCFARYLTADAPVQPRKDPLTEFRDLIKRIEATRTDKQTGAGATSGGSTDLVSKGLTSKALSIAAQYGALTESVNQRVVTVQGSFDGIPAALVLHNFVEFCPASADKNCAHKELFDFLRNISYSISFDTSRSQSAPATATGTQPNQTQPVTLAASGQQISSVTGRWALWNQRDTGSAYVEKWKQLDANIKEASAALFAAFKTFVATATVPQDWFATWQKRAIDEVGNARPAELETVWNQLAEEYVNKLKETHPEDVSAIAVKYLQAKSVYTFASYNFAADLAKKPVLTFEYTNNRPAAQSPTSSFRLIFDKGLGKQALPAKPAAGTPPVAGTAPAASSAPPATSGATPAASTSPWSIAVNGAFTIYDTMPPATVPGASRWRDAQVAAQVQRDLGTVTLLGAAAVSLAYYFQYQNSPAILNVTPGEPLPGITFTGLPANAAQVFADKGNLHIGQLKLLLSPGLASVRVPLAISYSNRTELINKPTWKAQIGVSYDFDSLFGK